MKRLIIIIISICLLVGFVVGFTFSTVNEKVAIADDTRIYIPDGTDYAALLDTLDARQCLKSHGAFNRIAKLRGLPGHIKPGSYVVRPGSRVFSLVQKLYSGNQDPLRITINRHRTVGDLCQFLGSKLAFDADSLLALLQQDEFCARYGCTPQTVIGLFLQNTYEFYWTVSPAKFVERMAAESEQFWQSRDSRLADLCLTRQQVLALASIVEEETNCNEEKPDIASVYLNRLRIGMALQADPTVKFALGDFSVRRIKGSMLAIDSPYNTYRNAGLPPGPICIPSAASIDAVLQNKSTGYLYFCAKEDFSGRHNFAANAEQHAANARKFHNALNQRNIH